MKLEQLRELFGKDAFATDVCGITIDEVTAHGARCSMPVTPQHLNSNGDVQGGAIFTLCDTAFSVAANAGDRLTVSRSADITYLKPGRGSRLYAVATELSRGGSMCLYRVSVFDDGQRLVAEMTGNGYFLAK